VTVPTTTADDFSTPRPRPGAPNVVVILFDDMGFAQLGCYGSDIDTPNIDRLATGGLRYNRFHVTALCSPSRASLLTGRNHHAVGMGFLADAPLALPGYSGRVPRSAATLPRLLRDAGYSTMAMGKWHLVPRGERSHAGPFDRWPLGFGFERFYGFLQGDTNQWTPNLVRDNHYVDPPRTYEEGYHFTEDIADEAIRAIIDQQHAAPGKPFFLYFAPGAMHSPHHVAKEWAERHAGRYDDGWERFRERAFARQREMGVVPDTAVLTERPSWVPAWDDLAADAKRLFAAMHETYAGFLSHTDAQIGRLLDALARIGELDNTIVLLTSDNGASAEGGQLGTVNEHRFSMRLPETVEDSLPYADDWGGPRTYSHYAWGWAWAGNTPFRLWKRYAWLGGTRVPLIVHWPQGIGADLAGGVRSQFGHVVDLMPTVLELAGVEAPEVVDGLPQQRIDGASLARTFADPQAPAPRDTQYFEMLGSRSIIAGRWKATTDHVSQGVPDEERLVEGSRAFPEDRWQLFDLEADFSEARDVAAEHPDVVDGLAALWEEEAERNHVLPMEDSLVARIKLILPPAYPAGLRRTFRPGGSPIVDECVPNLGGGGRVSAVIDVPQAGAEGVLCAIGDWNNGLALFVQDGRLAVALTAGSIVTKVTAADRLPAGRHTAAVDMAAGDGGVELTLACDDAVLGKGVSPVPMPHSWQHGGTALCIGFDRGFPVCEDYRPPFAWTGTVHEVTVEIPEPPRPAPADELRDALVSE